MRQVPSPEGRELIPAGVRQAARTLDEWHRRRGSGGHAGLWRSLFRGMGDEFRELREYAWGDDPKHLDWAASARTGHPTSGPTTPTCRPL